MSAVWIVQVRNERRAADLEWLSSFQKSLLIDRQRGSSGTAGCRQVCYGLIGCESTVVQLKESVRSHNAATQAGRRAQHVLRRSVYAGVTVRILAVNPVGHVQMGKSSAEVQPVFECSSSESRQASRHSKPAAFTQDLAVKPSAAVVGDDINRSTSRSGTVDRRATPTEHLYSIRAHHHQVIQQW